MANKSPQRVQMVVTIHLDVVDPIAVQAADLRISHDQASDQDVVVAGDLEGSLVWLTVGKVREGLTAVDWGVDVPSVQCALRPQDADGSWPVFSVPPMGAVD